MIEIFSPENYVKKDTKIENLIEVSNGEITDKVKSIPLMPFLLQWHEWYII